jgi:hypothetical protein
MPSLTKRASNLCKEAKSCNCWSYLELKKQSNYFYPTGLSIRNLGWAGSSMIVDLFKHTNSFNMELSRITWNTSTKFNTDPLFFHFKGSVQRKLRWVENGVNRSIGALDCGAGHSFVVLF